MQYAAKPPQMLPTTRKREEKEVRTQRHQRKMNLSLLILLASPFRSVGAKVASVEEIEIEESKSTNCTWNVKQIPRVNAADIPSVKDFWKTYAEIPVIITGIAEAFVDDGTDYFAFMIQKCPHGKMPGWKGRKKRVNDLRICGILARSRLRNSSTTSSTNKRR